MASGQPTIEASRRPRSGAPGMQPPARAAVQPGRALAPGHPLAARRRYHRSAMPNLPSAIHGPTLPDGPDQLSPEWLTAALRPAGVLDGASVASAEAELIAVARGIGGRVARVRLGYDRPAARAPTSLVAKFPSAIALTRGGGRVLRLPEREVRFYRELAAQLPLRTPACYFAAVDDAGDAFVLLLEDLGALPHGDDATGTTIARAETFVDAIATLHAAWWQSPRLDDLGWMPRIDERAPMWQRLFATAWRGHRAEASAIVPASMLPLAELLTRRLGYVFERLAASPHTLLHGDLRLDNLFFPAPSPEAEAEPALVAVDWSNAARGPGPYDLAYCMCVAFEPEQRRAHEQALLRSYHAALLARGVAGYPFEHCFDDYRLSFLEPFARMFVLLLGGHAEKGHTRPAEVMRKFVRNAAHAALDLDAGDLLAD